MTTNWKLCACGCRSVLDARDRVVCVIAHDRSATEIELIVSTPELLDLAHSAVNSIIDHWTRDGDDADVVSYVLGGQDRQHVIESRLRVALRDESQTWWRLLEKSADAQRRPLSDWEYEELEATGRVTTKESAAVVWVSGGRP